MIDWVKISEFAPSVVVALLFAWFCLALIKELRSNNKDIMDDWGKRLDGMVVSWQQTVKDLNEQWRTTILENREQANASTARLAEEIKRLAEQQAGLTTLMMSHDERAQRIKEMVSDLQKGK